MRHQRKTIKLGRKEGHRKSLLANQVCSLIEHSRIKTTLAKAKAVRPLAEKMVTLGKKKTLHARRTALAVLRQAAAVKTLFDDVAPRSADRKGGYTRIIKLGMRRSDAAEMAFIEWVDAPVVVEIAAPEPKPAKKAAKPKTETPPEPAAKEKTKPAAASTTKEKSEPAPKPAAEAPSKPAKKTSPSKTADKKAGE